LFSNKIDDTLDIAKLRRRLHTRRPHTLDYLAIHDRTLRKAFQSPDIGSLAKYTATGRILMAKQRAHRCVQASSLFAGRKHTGTYLQKLRGN
jgi:hypothetical protein